MGEAENVVNHVSKEVVGVVVERVYLFSTKTGNYNYNNYTVGFAAEK